MQRKAGDVNQEQIMCRESRRVTEAPENMKHEGQEKQSDGCQGERSNINQHQGLSYSNTKWKRKQGPAGLFIHF